MLAYARGFAPLVDSTSDLRSSSSMNMRSFSDACSLSVSSSSSFLCSRLSTLLPNTSPLWVCLCSSSRVFDRSASSVLLTPSIVWMCRSSFCSTSFELLVRFSISVL